jgi:bifunctional oligoribonuclease and PAP phosphatase NrnA
MSDFQPVVDFLGRHDRFIITSHETPDGDAIGSECAMARALAQLGRTVLVFNADPTPRKFRFVDPDNVVQVLEGRRQLPRDLESWALLMLDVNDPQNIGQVAELVLPRVSEHFIIDHHENEGDILAGNFVQKSASSTAEILHPLFSALGVTVDYPIALALYTAIVYDTGSFIYPKTTALTFGIARDLVERGVEPNVVYAAMYESNSIPALVLHSRVLATLELELGDHVAVLVMRREMIAESGAIYEDADQFINIPLKSEDIRVSVFFKENPEGLMRCSMRSKGAIDVAEIAGRFGGGGHRTAAGFKCREPLAETRRAVLAMLAKYFP